MSKTKSDELAVAGPQGQTQALAPRDKSIKGLLQGPEIKAQIATALPKHMKPERMIRIAMTALTRTPALKQCTPESFFRCLIDLSSYGLEPDGRRAHLIPYGKECTLIIDYKGIAELVRRSGDVSYIHADVVYENDEWSYAYGSKAHLEHVPTMAKDRGDPICFYSFVKLKDGSEDFVVMSKAEVDAVRKRSKASSKGPWVTDYTEMGKKTVFRRHSKWLPLSPEVRDAVEADDDAAGSVEIFPVEESRPKTQPKPSRLAAVEQEADVVDDEPDTEPGEDEEEFG